MKLENEFKPALCWIKGQPKENGMYLVRCENLSGHVWFYLFECRMDTDMPKERRRNLPLYYDAVGGNYASDYAMQSRGAVSHHCKATGENFAQIMNGLADYSFDFDKREYVKLNG